MQAPVRTDQQPAGVEGYNPSDALQPEHSATQEQYFDALQQPSYDPLENIKQAVHAHSSNSSETRRHSSDSQPGYSTAHERTASGNEQSGDSPTQGQHPVQTIQQQTAREIGSPILNEPPRQHAATTLDNSYGDQQPSYSNVQRRNTYSGQQPGYLEAQEQYAGGRHQTMPDYPGEGMDQRLREHSFMSNDQPRRHSTMRDHLGESFMQNIQEDNAFGNEQPRQHSATRGQQDDESGVHPSYSNIQTHLQTAAVNPVLEGHVFARMQLFATLPESLRDDTWQFQAYVESDKRRLFEINKRALVKSVYSVKGKDLVDAILPWLFGRYAARGTSSTSTATGVSTAQQSSQMLIGAETIKLAAVPKTTAPVTAEMLQCSKLIAEALVLSGFLTFYKEDYKHMNTGAPEYHVGEEELLVPAAKSVSELETTSVWSVADGAIYARVLKRKAGLFGQLTGGKDVYLVLNEITRKAYLFGSDLAREPIDELRGDMINVELDDSHYVFGVRVVGLSSNMDKEKPELFDACTKRKQEELVEMWRRIGAVQYRDQKYTPGAADTHATRDDSLRQSKLMNANPATPEELAPAPPQDTVEKEAPFAAPHQDLVRDEHSAPTAA